MAQLALNLFISLNLLILTLLITLKKDRVLSDIVLALIVFDQFLYFFTNVCILTGWIHLVPHLLFLSLLAAQANPPLIVFYVNLMLCRRTERLQVNYVLTAAAVALILVFWIGFLRGGASERLSFLSRLTGKDYPWQIKALNLSLVLTQFCYLLQAILRVRKYLRGPDEARHAEEVHVRSSHVNNLLIFILNLATGLAYAVLPATAVVYVVAPLSVIVMHSFFVYSVFRHSEAFSSANTPDAGNGASPHAKRPSINLEPELARSYASRVLRCFAENKPYLDPELTLDTLARRLGIQRHLLSFVINRELNRSFFELVDYYRVEEAKKVLLDIGAKAFSVDAVGYEVGFNTKSAFYRSFKKLTGQTPALFSRSLAT